MDDLYAGYTGSVDYGKKGKVYKDLRFLFNTQFNVLHYIVLDKINRWADLNGKPVAIYTGTSNILTKRLMEANNVKPSSVAVIQEVEILVDKLKRKDIVAFLGKSGIKDSLTVQILTQVEGTKLLPVPKEMLDIGNKKYPGSFMPAVISASWYNLPKDIPSNRFFTGVCTTKDMREDVIYTLAKLAYENREELADTYGGTKESFRRWPEFSIESNAGVPFHSGMVKFLRELGLQVPKELIPPEMK